MKILAVRGANLASLAKDFQIDFSSSPLADTGIFAITGKTGSGKSTILDAISLALYNKIARIPKREKTRQKSIEDNSSPLAHDVRTILRTGAGQAFAEVDYIGLDKKKYRARWQVRRARKKAHGKLQNVEISLIDLTTNRNIGGKITETLETIKKSIGLDFEQFNRTVLLSQGEFDAFLKAKESERSLLLEALTGTEIYSTISKAVNQRYREENSKLDAIKIKLGENQPLSQDERQAKEEIAVSLTKSVTNIKTILNLLEKSQEWYQLQETLQNRLATAQAELKGAQQEEIDNQPQRDTFNLVLKAQMLAPDHKAMLQSKEKQSALQTEQKKLGIDLQNLENQAKTSESEHKKAQDNFLNSKKALLNKQEELNQAATFDTQIKDVAEARLNSINIALKDQEQLRSVEKQKQIILEKRAVILESLQKNEIWLKQHSTWQVLEERFKDIEQDILQFSSTNKKIEALDRTAILVNGQIAEISEQIVQFIKEKEKLTKAISKEEERQKPILLRMKSAPNPQALQEEQQLNSKQTQELNQLLTVITEYSSNIAKTTQRQQQLGTNNQQVEKLTQEQLQIDEQLNRVTIQLEEAKYGSMLAQATAGKEALQLRKLLKNNSPCPVCGATEHLIKTDNLSQLAKAQKKRVDELATNENKTRQKQQELIKNIQKNLSEKLQHEESITAIKAEQNSMEQSWLTLKQTDSTAIFKRLSLADQPQPENSTVIIKSLQELEKQHQKNSTTLKKLHKDQEENQKIENSLKDGQKQINKIEQNILTKQGELEREKQTIQESDRTIKLHQESLDKLKKRLTNLQLLADEWQQSITADPEAIITDLIEKKAQWLKIIAENKTTLEQREINAKARQVENEKHFAAKSAYERSQSRVKEYETKLADLQEKRNELLGGKSCQEVKNKLEQAIDKADSQLQKAISSKTNLQTEIAQIKGRQDGLIKQLEQNEKELITGQKNLEEKCQAHKITNQELIFGLDWSQKQITDEQKRLDSLKENVSIKKQQLQYQQQTLSEEQRNNLPPLGLEAINQCQIKQKEILKTEDNKLAVALGELHSDNNIKKRKSTLIASLTSQQKQTDIWDKMNDLIGSSSGDKFRKFAQSITLDRLVELANYHLTELTPRYRLQRAIQGDLSLQVVDLEMGSEIRGIANLSGGERFLTSLAMALGLAGMSSNRGIQVESLFIDEGFGALDEASLNIAISALEALQASGRVVGIISHISALTERIGVQIQVQSQGGGRSEIAMVVS
ncbi:MAG: AAA family ATPase [Magnetococcales bacterium]|nr:AAA family ATPase [Magnetococcales bacterium]